MTYGFRPENWPVFQTELQKRGISTLEIEKVEMRPTEDPDVVLEERHRIVDITVTLDLAGRNRGGNFERRPANSLGAKPHNAAVDHDPI